MAQKKKKTLSSRPPVPSRARELTFNDYSAAALTILLLCAVAGLILARVFALNEADETALAPMMGGGMTPGASPAWAYAKCLVGMLLGVGAGFLMVREIPREQLASLNFAGKILLIVLPVLAVYYPNMFAGFIWDDDQLVTANPSLREGWSGLADIWIGRKSADYFPLMSSVLWFQYQLSPLFNAFNIDFLQRHPGALNGYHISNIVVHAANSVLVWLMLRRLTVPGAWLAGLIFALYPVHVESVAWVAECKNTLSTLFYLLAIIAWVNYEDREKRLDYVLVLLLTLAGLLCKTHLVVLPPVLVLISLWRRGFDGVFTNPINSGEERRFMQIINAVIGVICIVAGIAEFIFLIWMVRTYAVDPNNAIIKATYMMKEGKVATEFWILASACLGVGLVGVCEGLWGRRLNQILVRSLALFQIGILLGGLTVGFQYARAIGDERIPIGGLPSRIANAGKASWWYLSKAVSPVNLWYEMPSRELEPEAEALAIIDHKMPQRVAPALPVGKIKFWPIITIYPRWRVTPPMWYDFIPAIMMASLFWATWHFRSRIGRAPFFALAYFLLTLFPVLGFLKMSYMRLTVVADHFQYISDISIIALGCAAGTLAWRKASPSLKPVLVGLAAFLVFGFTVYSFDRVKIYENEFTLWADNLSKNSNAWQAHNHMGAVLFMQRRIPEATAHFAESCRLKPENPESHNNLGLGYMSMGRVDEGIAEYRRAIKIRNWEPSMHTNLANALGQTGRYDEALIEYKESIRLNPRDVGAYCNLGYVLLQKGQVDEAIIYLKKALEIDPNMEQAKRNLEEALRRRKTFH